MVIAVPAVPIVGVNSAMDGGLGPPAVTVNDSLLVADPFNEITVTVPLVAPKGTVATTEFALAELIVAAVPLKLTESRLVVGLNPDPEIVIWVPTGPSSGDISEIDVDELPPPPPVPLFVVIERRFPTAS